MKTVWIERLVLLVAVSVAWWAWTAKQHAEDRAIISAENEAAARDTLRVVVLGKTRTEQATLMALSQHRVALTGALARLARSEGVVARLQARLAVTVEGVDTTIYTDPAPILGTNVPILGTDTFHVRDSISLEGPPITGTVVADLSPFRPGEWSLQLQPDPIPLRVVVGCRKPGQPPSIIVTGPVWADVGAVTGELDPKICHPTRQKARWPWFLGGLGLGILIWEAAR